MSSSPHRSGKSDPFDAVAVGGEQDHVARSGDVRPDRQHLGQGTLPRNLPVITGLGEARELALAGGDPIQVRREAKAIMTFEEAARKVQALHLPTWRNPKHGAQFIAPLETYAFPQMGCLRVRSCWSPTLPSP